MNKIKKIDYELLLFTFFIFFQNFALIRTKSFGISGLSLFLVYIFFKYKYYKNLNLKFILFVLITFIFIALETYFNKVFYFTQIMRYFLVVFIVYTGYFYIKDIFQKHKEDKLLDYMFKFTIFICIYGIYQIYASLYRLPMFLNIFSNNPSYAVRGLYGGYSGWTSFDRIYTTFFEPSAYAVFLANLIFIFILYYKKDKKDSFISHKFMFIYTMIMMIINLILTSSRSGWMIILCYIMLCIYYKYLSKSKILNKIVNVLTIMLPFIIFASMYLAGLLIFKDKSSFVRTYSSLYYLIKSSKNILFIIIGHGLGTINIGEYCINFHKVIIEPFAHNGYIELVYQFGWIYFLFLIITINKFISKGLKNNNWFAYASVSTLCCFGTLYNVDSLAVIAVLIICFSKFYVRSKK